MNTQEMEKSLIGILLHRPEYFIFISQIVTFKDFLNSNCRKAYSAMLSMWMGKEHIDLVSVATTMTELSVFLSDASDIIPSKSSARNYATYIADAARMHRIKNEMSRIATTDNPVYALSDLSTLIRDEDTASKKDNSIGEVISRFEETRAKNKEAGMIGIETGFNFIEQMYITYQPGHIWTLGGFTSVGKTAVMVEMISRLLNNGKKIMVISTEMTETQIVARIVANRTEIPTNNILSGKGNDFHLRQIKNCLHSIGESGLIIHDDVYTISDIEAVCRRADLQGGVDVVFIDYVQNCQVPEAKSEYQEQATLAKRLQKMAKDNSATVICLSQVSNSVGRGDSPILELKGAGEWAAVSDISIMLSRLKGDKYGLAFQIKKNRHGIKHADDEGHRLIFQANFTSLEEAEQLANR